MPNLAITQQSLAQVAAGTHAFFEDDGAVVIKPLDRGGARLRVAAWLSGFKPFTDSAFVKANLPMCDPQKILGAIQSVASGRESRKAAALDVAYTAAGTMGNLIKDRLARRLGAGEGGQPTVSQRIEGGRLAVTMLHHLVANEKAILGHINTTLLQAFGEGDQEIPSGWKVSIATINEELHGLARSAVPGGDDQATQSRQQVLDNALTGKMSEIDQLKVARMWINDRNVRQFRAGLAERLPEQGQGPVRASAVVDSYRAELASGALRATEVHTSGDIEAAVDRHVLNQRGLYLKQVLGNQLDENFCIAAARSNPGGAQLAAAASAPGLTPAEARWYQRHMLAQSMTFESLVPQVPADLRDGLDSDATRLRLLEAGRLLGRAIEAGLDGPAPSVGDPAVDAAAIAARLHEAFGQHLETCLRGLGVIDGMKGLDASERETLQARLQDLVMRTGGTSQARADAIAGSLRSELAKMRADHLPQAGSDIPPGAGGDATQAYLQMAGSADTQGQEPMVLALNQSLSLLQAAHVSPSPQARREALAALLALHRQAGGTRLSDGPVQAGIERLLNLELRRKHAADATPARREEALADYAASIDALSRQLRGQALSALTYRSELVALDALAQAVARQQRIIAAS